MTLIHISAVFVGGGLGAVARHALSSLLARGNFPLGTLLVNVLGSLCIGLIIGALLLREDAAVWRLFLATGVMGGFTTFSAFALESVMLIQRDAWGAALFYVAASVMGCILACFIGLRVTS
jgi:fluoride exporter